ncbi:prepilin-type N-terminal cleavage/methylation domain-containing protein [Arcobacter sp. CECT 8986]|uniref:prepilin-type N-terminal cleavage/methylation domain-containing protein n=1 Tax=Arcobacter sp. CECT 8986 TaxID=2044507 RepID=UPI001009A07D|nr:prepilin-type N-terminal cleavage/methylation domain-containing protein [Arcobacter sp. CECT 8986]
MKKQKNLVANKKAFTIFETIISLTILAIVITLIYSLSFHNNLNSTFVLLNSLENSFTKKDYSNFNTKNQNITITKNSIKTKVSVKKIYYDKNGVNLYKYELYK